MSRIAALLALAAAGCATTAKVTKLVITGDDKTVRERPPNARPHSPGSTQILLLELDGVSRDMLYDLLRQGKLPNLTTLLGGDRLAHAYLDPTFLSGLPSTTMPAWVSVHTGEGAANSGVPGNEFFIRERRELAVPAPVSFDDPAPTLSIYTDDYLNKLVAAPSVYERIHLADPDALIWVGMNHFFRGADKLLLAKRTVIAKSLDGMLESVVDKLSGDKSREIYADLDKAAVDAIVSRLDDKAAVPDVLTVYISGTDLYAHQAKEGPDEARRDYLVEVFDPALEPLVKKLREKRALDDRWVIVTADHGHTPVLEDHAIGTGDDSLPGVLKQAGFRIRPFRQSVPDEDPFSAVLAYGGATAYLYLADRSKCPGEKDRCAWSDPPRYEEDVLAAAEAIYRNNESGGVSPKIKGTIDLILVRKPKPVAEIDAPFEVYVGGGKTMSVDAYLREHPHPTYIAVDARLRELAVGRYGERAGDIMLLAHDGDRDTPQDRYYFEGMPYRSWHGSPSRRDSEIPLIVAHPRRTAASIRSWVQPLLGDTPFQRKITDIVLKLRGVRDRARP